MIDLPERRLAANLSSVTRFSAATLGIASTCSLVPSAPAPPGLGPRMSRDAPDFPPSYLPCMHSTARLAWRKPSSGRHWQQSTETSARFA